MGGCESREKEEADPSVREFTVIDITDAELERNWREGHCQDSHLAITEQKRRHLAQRAQKKGDDSDTEETYVWTKNCIRCICAIELDIEPTPEELAAARKREEQRLKERQQKKKGDLESDDDDEAAAGVVQKPVRPLLVFAGTNSKTIRLWLVRKGLVTAFTPPRLRFDVPRAQRGEIRAMQCDKDYLVACTSRGLIMRWDMRKLDAPGMKLTKNGQAVHASGCTSLAFDGDTLLVGSLDNSISVWNLRTPTFVRRLNGHTAGVLCVALGKTRAVSGARDGTVCVWDLTKWVCIHTLSGHSGPVRCINFIDGFVQQDIACGDEGGFISVWETPNGRRKQQLRAHDAAVYSVAMSPGGERLISCSADNTTRIFVKRPVEGKAPEFAEAQRIRTALDEDPDTMARMAHLRMTPRTPYDIRVVYCFKAMDDKLVCGCSDGALLLYNFAISPKPLQLEVREETVDGDEEEEDY